MDTFIPCGRGQRLGIFAGSGVGKSTLLGMIASQAEADVNVIALIGERGREVREFLEKDLDEAGRKQIGGRRRHLQPAGHCAAQRAPLSPWPSRSISATRARTFC